MAVVQVTSTVSAQVRTVRAATTWSPPTGLMHTRPWRSSPLAGPAFSTLPPIISESSEESYEDDFAAENPRAFGQTQRSPSSSSIVSDSPAVSVSGYGSRSASGSGSALVLVQGEGSTSSISLHASSSAHGTPTASSSHGHRSSQTPSNRSARLSKSPGRRPSSAQEHLSHKNASETSITPPPRARTVSHGHSRSALFPAHPFAPSPTIPQTYSPSSPRPISPEFDPNATKQPPSTSRDPSSNWMSSSPFGPASVPKFSRLAMASPAVVMPLSAREYRKRKAKEPVENGKEKEPASSNRVTFSDTAPPASQPTPNGVPLVKVSLPPSEDVHKPRSPPSSSGDHSLDRQTQPQPQLNHPPPKPLPHASLSAQPQPLPKPRPSSPKQKRSRSRPNTPPRSSPLAAHPPISPKSSAGTFYSLVSASDDDTAPSSHPQGADDPNAVPPARPRLRPRRRKSYPDRLSNGARLSLLEAMNRLSQESASLHRLSQIDGANRLSVVSQASGHTLFYDVVESEEEGRVGGGNGDENGDGNRSGGGGQRTSVLHTQSLEDLSSTLARTGIEVVHPNGDGNPGAPLDDERKGKRNVRMVRISDTVEVSPPPVSRRRKLTKSRPAVRGSAPASGAGAGSALGTVKEETKVQTPTRTQTQERRASLLPWKSKGSGDPIKGGAGAGEKSAEDGHPSTPTGKGLVHSNGSTVPHSLTPVVNGSTPSTLGSTSPTKKPSTDTPTPTSTPSTPSRKTRRYTFSFLPTPTFHRPKRGKSDTAPTRADLGSDQHAMKSKLKGSSAKSVESGTDSTSTSIRTITQGSQSTLTPTVYDLTTPASSGVLSLAGGRGTSSSAVPMLRRLNAQAMATPGAPPLESAEWDGGGGDSTPSLVTNGSTATSSSVPRILPLPSFVRLPGGGGEPFVPRSSALKECFTDTSEEDEGVHGERVEKERMPKVCVHQRQDQRPVARGGVHVGGAETSEEEERAQLRGRSSSGLSLSQCPSPRPGTPSSTLTTATETSGSYISFSTVPASTMSSSSTSRSESPSLTMGDKPALGGDGDVYACALCGHLVSGSTSPPSSRFATREPDQVVTHPMFTVPLVTVPASAVTPVGTSPRSMHVSSSNVPRAGMGGGRDAGVDAKYVGGRKNEKHLSVPVPAAVVVGVPPARSGHDHDYNNCNYNHMHVHANGGYVPGPAATTRMMMSSSPAPPKVGKRRRPQTAPPGTGDAALKFIEDAKVMRVREGSVDFHVGGDRPTKPKVGSGESKFKTVLKGLLRWHG